MNDKSSWSIDNEIAVNLKATNKMVEKYLREKDAEEDVPNNEPWLCMHYYGPETSKDGRSVKISMMPQYEMENIIRNMKKFKIEYPAILSTDREFICFSDINVIKTTDGHMLILARLNNIQEKVPAATKNDIDEILEKFSEKNIS